MESERDDDIDDPGRRNSQIRLRHKMNTKYLDEVIEQNGLEYEETIEMIEREKKAIDSMDSGYLHAVDANLVGQKHGIANRDIDGKDKRTESAHALMSATDQLLKVSQKANRAVSGKQQSQTDPSKYQVARKRDQQRVKDILSAGKRVMEDDMDAVQQQAKAREHLNGNEEAAVQAVAVFGDRKRADSVAAENGKALKYMQKGVKKMTKGLSSDL